MIEEGFKVIDQKSKTMSKHLEGVYDFVIAEFLFREDNASKIDFNSITKFGPLEILSRNFRRIFIGDSTSATILHAHSRLLRTPNFNWNK